jgi:succinate dehydrogenase/fumarate reductase flavoprotein subunit
MTRKTDVGARLAAGKYDKEFTADVLVIGGSLAGSWAGIAAHQSGAKVIVADKGYAGAAGPIAAGSVGAYFLKPDDPIQRDAMINARMPLAFGLADSRWGEKILDQSYRNMQLMADWGYAWPLTSDGRQRRGTITPNVLAFLRRRLEFLGVRLLDKHPVLELLISDGVASGAAGIDRKTGETFLIRAGAIVLATGGTAFLSKTAGTGGNTGDGYLLAAEAGAHFSGMEFTSQFHIRPYGGTQTKGTYRGGDSGGWAQLTDNHGKPVNLGRQTAKAIMETGAVWDSFESVRDPEMRKLVIGAFYGTSQFFEDAGIDPFQGRHRADWILEGTLRATGGIEIDNRLQTAVPGLFASGDVSTREKVNGAGPPGGGPAAGWALGAGFYSGREAAAFAKAIGPVHASRAARPVGQAGLRPTGPRREVDLKAVLRPIQEHMEALDRNYLREEKTLKSSLAEYAAIWRRLKSDLAGPEADTARESARGTLKARETAALLQAARWINATALERTETRGLHRRSDFPNLDPAQHHHLITGGLDEVWVKVKPVDPTAEYPAKAETEKMAAEARRAKAEGREYQAPPAFVAPSSKAAAFGAAEPGKSPSQPKPELEARTA